MNILMLKLKLIVWLTFWWSKVVFLALIGVSLWIVVILSGIMIYETFLIVVAWRFLDIVLEINQN